MKIALSKLFVLDVIFLLLISYALHPKIEYTFRYAARYSGKLSTFIFLFTFYLFSQKPSSITHNTLALNFIKLFAVLHVIPFGFLALSVYLNSIPLKTIKLTGGGLVYSMIALAPFFFKNIK